MRNKILLLISVFVVLLLVVSCAPPMTDEELEAELAKLTPEEREALVADLENKEGGALAGQAVSASIAAKYKISTKVATVPKAKVITFAKTKFQPTSVSFCIESDNGADYYVKGVIHLKLDKAEWEEFRGDYCFIKSVQDAHESSYPKCVGSYCYIKEVGCVHPFEFKPGKSLGIAAITTEYLTFSDFKCPSGCEDGACLPVPN